MKPLAQIPPPPTKEQLVELFRDPVTKIVREDVAGDAEPERLYQLRQAQRNDLYWRGLQYNIPQLSESGIASFSALGTPLTSDGDRDGSPLGVYDYVQNIYRGYGRKYSGVLGQRAPNVLAVPDDPEDEDSLAMARRAETAAQILRANWDADLRNLELAQQLWKNGTTFGYTPYVTNGSKYGNSTEPRIEVRTVEVAPAAFECVQCGQKTPEAEAASGVCQCGRPFAPEDRREAETMDSPETVGAQQYENGAVEFHLTNIMCVSLPFFAHDLEDAPWLDYEYEEYKGKLLSAYPKVRELNLDSSGGESESAASGIGTIVRDTAASPIGVPNPHRSSRWKYRRIWLKPEMWEMAQDDQIRQGLLQHFPDGAKVTFIQGLLIDIEAEKLTDLWSMAKPETSEYIFCDPAGQDMVSIQDLKNDTLNIAAETIERGLSVTFADPRVIDIDQWSKKQAMPAEIVPVLAGVGESLSDSFWQVPPTHFSDQLLPWMASVEQDTKTIVGTTEAIYGGALPGDQQTAHEAELRKNAAMMQLGIAWQYMRKFWESTYKNGVRQLARFGAGTITGSRKTAKGYQALSVNLAELKEDGWHMEAEEAIPMTAGQQRDFLMFMMEKPPEVQTRYGFLHPRNIERNQALLGMPGYYVPGIDSHEKARDTIGQLLKAAPIQQPDPSGQIQLEPSIPIDEYDDHATMAEEARAWLTGDGRRQRDENPDGFMNVIAWWRAHNQAAQPPAPPAPAPPAPQPKLNISARIADLAPAAQASVFQDFGIQAPPEPVPQNTAAQPPAAAPGAGFPPGPTPGAPAPVPAMAVQ